MMENSEASENQVENEKNPQTYDRANWRIPDDLHWTEDPNQCFERTTEQTEFKFEGFSKINPETRMFFSIPVYYEEWIQGNIQKSLLAAFANGREQQNPIEITYILNFLGKDRKEDNNSWTKKKALLKKFEKNNIPGAEQNNLQLDWDGTPIPEYDFSTMSRDEYLQYVELNCGKHLSYEEELENTYSWMDDSAEKVQSIVQINEEISEFFKDLACIQKIGAEAIKFPKINLIKNGLKRIFKIIQPTEQIFSKYANAPELLKILQQAHQFADRVQISMIDTVHADYMAEGYGRKGLAAARCIGSDLARLRSKQINNQRWVFQSWDADLALSRNFVDELIAFYDRHPEIKFTSLPIASMPSPGTSAELFESSLDFNLAWTAARSKHSVNSTPTLSMAGELLEELNGIVGDPPGASYWEDRKLETRISRWATNDRKIMKDHCQTQVDFPAINSYMLDREGIVDGQGRINGGRWEKGSQVLIDFYREDFNFDFLEGEDKQSKTEVFQHAYEQYFKDVNRLAKLNRAVLKSFIRAKSNGAVVKKDKLFSIDYEKIPVAVRADLHNYVEHNQQFLMSLSDDDWNYLSYLLGDNSLPQPKALTALQETLREYLGDPIGIEDLASKIIDGTRDVTDRSSIYYCLSAFKLAKTLVKRNFSIDDPFDMSPNPICVVMADFADRSKGILQAMISSNEPTKK